MRSRNRQLRLFAAATADQLRKPIKATSKIAADRSSQKTFAAENAANPITSKSIVKVAADVAADKLWICLYFPNLCLAAVSSNTSQPEVVVIEQHRQGMVLAANAQANAVGIASGVTLNAALALLPGVVVKARDESAEQCWLAELAQWALQFTPVVSMVNQGVLLEVRSSLRLFGGLQALCARLVGELQARDQHADMRLSYAPTALAALWIARASGSEPYAPGGCAAITDLASVLADLPLNCLGWPESVQHKLQRMGLRAIGDCLRLPRDGFARRVGKQYLQQLDQAMGRHPDLQPCIQAPIQFRAQLELLTESVQTDSILQLCRELLARLQDFLKRRQRGIRQLHVELLHYQHPATVLTVSSRVADSRVDYLQELLSIKLDGLVLQRPVSGVCIVAEAEDRDLPLDHDLFHTALLESDKRQGEYLLARLRTRLGAAQVHFIREHAEHRPENAWAAIDQPLVGPSELPGELLYRPRPLWLLEKPRRLHTASGLPIWHGTLLFDNSAERIESGWWDGNDVRRDYYAVINRAGSHAWVFQDCRSSVWYLHGIFA